MAMRNPLKIIMLLFLLLGVAGTANSAGTVVKYMWNGGGASASWADQYGSSWLEVNESTVNHQPVAYLSFNTNRVDPTSEVCLTDQDGNTYCFYSRYYWEYGYGQIPIGDFKASSNGATVNTSLSGSPNFYYTRCDSDEINWTWTCTDEAPAVTISLTWSNSRESSSFNSGVNESRFGKYMYRTNGSYRSVSARVSGSFLGYALPDDTRGNISIGLNVAREIIVAPKP